MYYDPDRDSAVEEALRKEEARRRREESAPWVF
jgi:hypothetical protein